MFDLADLPNLRWWCVCGGQEDSIVSIELDDRRHAKHGKCPETVVLTDSVYGFVFSVVRDVVGEKCPMSDCVKQCTDVRTYVIVCIRVRMYVCTCKREYFHI